MPRGHESSEPRRPSATENHCGRIVGDRFRLEAVVHSTPTTSLYRARDLRGGSVVAVKLIHPELDDGRTERAQREGRILAQLRHPHIAEFIDCSRTPEGLFYIATAFIDGHSLDHWCAADQAGLPTQTVWQIGVQVAEALICAHGAGVIHRDVKPSNIMWWPESQTAKLTDFEIAKVTPSTSLDLTPQRHPTAIGVPIGTFGYIPPEAGETIDPRTDVFGLGRTLYRLLTRRPAQDWPQGLQETPEPLRTVVMDAGAPEPSYRPATMAEFRGRLLAAGLHLFPQSAQGPSMRPAARHLWPVPTDREAAPLPEAGCSVAAAGDPCTATSPPQLFERRLELRLQLGGGRGGETWHAYHHVLDCDVVVKRVPPALAATEYPAKLRREAAALQKIPHPAFPRVYECDVAEADGSWYMVQEHIDGETFSAMLRRGRPDLLVAVELVASLAEALAAAHARGVVHGDIHPGNFMVEKTSPPRARVIDLNECRLLDHYFAATPQRYAPPPPLRTDPPPHQGVGMGRPEFVAPEIMRGGRATVRSDVYGLGCIALALITGDQAPAVVAGTILKRGPRETFGERLEEHMLEHAPDLDSSELLTAIDDVLAPEPERRKITMAQFAVVLRSTAESIRVIRAPVPPPEPSRASAPPPTSVPPATSGPPTTASATSATSSRVSLGLVVVGAALVAALVAAWPRERDEAPALAAMPTASTATEAPAVPTAPLEAPSPPLAAVPVAEAPSPAPVPAAAVPKSKPRREQPPARRDPVTVAEATAAASAGLAGIRTCAGAPRVVAAQLDIRGERGRVVALNFKPAEQFGADSWETCVRRELDRVRYPDSAKGSQVRLRLQL